MMTEIVITTQSQEDQLLPWSDSSAFLEPYLLYKHLFLQRQDLSMNQLLLITKLVAASVSVSASIRSKDACSLISSKLSKDSFFAHTFFAAIQTYLSIYYGALPKKNTINPWCTCMDKQQLYLKQPEKTSSKMLASGTGLCTSEASRGLNRISHCKGIF